MRNEPRKDVSLSFHAKAARLCSRSKARSDSVKYTFQSQGRADEASRTRLLTDVDRSSFSVDTRRSLDHDEYNHGGQSRDKSDGSLIRTLRVCTSDVADRRRAARGTRRISFDPLSLLPPALCEVNVPWANQWNSIIGFGATKKENTRLLNHRFQRDTR